MSEDLKDKEDKKKEKVAKTSKPVRVKRPSMVNKGPLSVREDLKDPEYTYRWVNDSNWNLSDKIAQDYEFVEDPNDEMQVKDTTMEGAKFGSKVFKAVGNKITGYLMRKRKVWYDEDQKEKEKAINERLHSQPTESGIFNEKMEITKPEKVDDFNN